MESEIALSPYKGLYESLIRLNHLDRAQMNLLGARAGLNQALVEIYIAKNGLIMAQMEEISAVIGRREETVKEIVAKLNAEEIAGTAGALN